jgi:hypothetical protein
MSTKSSSSAICASGIDFMSFRRKAFDLQRKGVILVGDGVQLEEMEVDGRVVMSNEAAVLIRHRYPPHA